MTISSLVDDLSHWTDDRDSKKLTITHEELINKALSGDKESLYLIIERAKYVGELNESENQAGADI